MNAEQLAGMAIGFLIGALATMAVFRSTLAEHGKDITHHAEKLGEQKVHIEKAQKDIDAIGQLMRQGFAEVRAELRDKGLA